MNKGLPTTAAIILALSLASPAFGKASYPGFERDMALAFENDGEPMELALLSDQEMRETKGAVISDLIARITFGGVSGGAVYWMSYFGSPDFSYRGFAEAVGAGAFGGLFGLTRGGQVILGAGTSAALGRWLDQVPTDG